jgi:hypothetical protein
MIENYLSYLDHCKFHSADHTVDSFTVWHPERLKKRYYLRSVLPCTAHIGISVVDPDTDPDPQISGTFAGTGSVTRGFRIRVHIRKWMSTLTKTIKKRGNFIILTIFI